MASRNPNLNKHELVAIYRLQFYKNKKNWKLSPEKQSQSKIRQKPTKTARNNTLNETYNVDAVSDSEKRNTPLNSAFMHEIPRDEVPLPEFTKPIPPPSTPQSQGDQHTNQTADPHLLEKGMWQGPGSERLADKIHQDAWSNRGLEDDQQMLQGSQGTSAPNTPTGQHPWTNQDQHPWPNQDQPVNNLQWLLKNANLGTWHPPPNPGPILPNTWSNQTKPTGKPDQTIWNRQQCTKEIIGQEEWKIPLSQRKDSIGMSAQHPWLINNCPKTAIGQWNNNIDPQNRLTNQGGITQNEELGFILPDTTVPPPPLTIIQNAWPHQKVPYHQNVWVKQEALGTNVTGQQFPPEDIIQIFQRTTLEDTDLGVPDSGQQKFLEGLRSNQGVLRSEKTDTWNNEDIGSCNSEGFPQNVWINQAWQQKQELWQNGDKEKGGQEWFDIATVDATDGLYDEIANNEPQSQMTQAEQCTLKAPPSAESLDTQTPEQIREHTDCWLQRLMMLHRLNNDCCSDSQPCEQYQRGHNDSSDFVREAHDVAHSSENDPNESLEWIWSLTSPGSLPALSTRGLSAAIGHVTNTLRGLLKEQLIRDQLRSQRGLDVEEYPTRDTELFDSEYVLSGSHLPRSTRDFAAPTHKRLIKIDMGRPYRL